MKIKKEDNSPVTGTLTVEQVLAKITKEHGPGIIRVLGDNKIEKVDVISTGSILIDNALVIGGFPRGRIMEVYGAEGGGKTSLSLHAIANVQSNGGAAAFVDAEHSLDLEMAKNMGVNVKDLVLSQPDYGEQALEILDSLVESGIFHIAVLDSVAALVPKAELEGTMEDQQMGLQARMMGKALRKLVGKASKTNTCVIFINQIRSKIGQSYGDPDVTSGGRALKFYSSVRLDIRRIGAIKKGEEVIGNRVKIKVVKNKLAPPFRSAETDFIFGKGFNKVGEIIDVAESMDLIERNGSWYAYHDERIGQGKPAACDFLTEHKDIQDKLLADIQIGGGLNGKSSDKKEIQHDDNQEIL